MGQQPSEGAPRYHLNLAATILTLQTRGPYRNDDGHNSVVVVVKVTIINTCIMLASCQVLV